jgi:hypothetical protein
LRALAEFLGEVFPEAKGKIAQEKVRDVSERIRENLQIDRQFDSYIRLDVRNFYPSIRHSDIRNALTTKIRKPEIVQSILRAVQTPTVADRDPAGKRQAQGVPQGLAISNILAELVARPIDELFQSDQRCDYFRYVDDILILCHESDVRSLAAEASSEFLRLGLTVHPIDRSGKSRSGVLADGFDYLGYVFTVDPASMPGDVLISVRTPSVGKLEASLVRTFTRYTRAREENSPDALGQFQMRINTAIAGCIYENNPRGWLPYFRQTNDKTLLKRLDAMVQQLCRRFKVPKDIETKTFTRAHWAMRYPHGRYATYIPNYDNLRVDEQRAILKNLIGSEEAAQLAERAVPTAFRKAMRHTMADMERDIGAIS